MLETRYHDAASSGINGSAGAWVQVETAAALTAAAVAIKGAWNGPEPIAIGVGATAGAVTAIAAINAGEDFEYGSSLLAAGAKLWVRSLSATAISDGRLTLNVMG